MTLKVLVVDLYAQFRFIYPPNPKSMGLRDQMGLNGASFLSFMLMGNCYGYWIGVVVFIVMLLSK